jgi:hypothetical protein
MTLTQQEADRIQAKYEDTIAGYLGMPTPTDMQVIVLSRTAYDAKFPGGNTGGMAAGHTVYVPADVSPSRAAAIVAYETAHGMIMGSNMDAGTSMGDNGLIGSKAGKAAEALSGVIANKLHLQPDGWQPDQGVQTHLNDLTAEQLQAVSASIQNGTFTTVREIANAASTGTPPANGTTPVQPPSSGPNTMPGAPPSTTLPPITLANGSTLTTNADGTVTVTTSAGVSTQYPDIAAAMAAGAASTTATPGSLGNPSKPQYRHNTEATFRSMLQGWGIQDTPGIEALILQATNGNYNADRFLQALRQTAEYQAAFPGIGPNMSESAYQANMKSYQATADRYGINLTDALKANLFAGHVRPEVFAARANATVVLDKNKAVFEQFQRQLADAGLPPATRSELLNHIMGMSNSTFKDVWEGANIGATAKAEGAPLGEKGINKIQSLTAGMNLSDIVKGTADFANKVRTQMGTQEARSFGLTRSDLLAAEFGGPGAGAASDKLQRVMDTHSAFFAQRFGHTPMQVSQGGFASIGGQQDQAQVQ